VWGQDQEKWGGRKEKILAGKGDQSMLHAHTHTHTHTHMCAHAHTHTKIA
jgi:hypothetical protein